MPVLGLALGLPYSQPPASEAAPATDPYFSSVTYLVTNEGTNGSTPTPAVVGGTTNGVTIGCYFKGDSTPCTGFYGPVRINNGDGRYTTSFTPSLPLPES